jgi:hypothetical protein
MAVANLPKNDSEHSKLVAKTLEQVAPTVMKFEK